MLRKIVSNTFFQLLAKFVGAGLTFVTTVLIIRLTSPDLYGDLTKVLALVAIGFTAIDFGLNAEAVRSMKGGIDKEREVFGSTLLARGLLSVIAIVCVNIVVNALPGGYTPEIKSIFWIASLAILFQGVYTSANAWFQKRLEYWKMSIATILGAIIGAILTYLAVTASPTLKNLLVASTVGYVVMGVCAVLLLPKTKLLIVQFRSALQLLKRSLPLGLILVLSILASKIDAILLGIYRPSSEVGQYGFAYRVFDVILVLPVFVMNSVYPLLVEENWIGKNRLISRSLFSLLSISLIGVLVFWFVSPLISYIRPGMDIAISSLRILVLSLPFFYVTAPLMWQLIEARLEKYLLLVYLVAAVFNGLVNYMFVPQYGATASAYLTGLTELLILVGLLIVRQRFLTIH